MFPSDLEFRNLKEKQAGSSVNAKVGQAVATATALLRPALTQAKSMIFVFDKTLGKQFSFSLTLLLDSHCNEIEINGDPLCEIGKLLTPKLATSFGY